MGSLPLVTSRQGKKWEEMSAQLRAGAEAVLLTFFFFLIYIAHRSNKTVLDRAQGRKGRVM